jgi:hypothetical protein
MPAQIFCSPEFEQVCFVQAKGAKRKRELRRQGEKEKGLSHRANRGKEFRWLPKINSLKSIYFLCLSSLTENLSRTGYSKK